MGNAIALPRTGGAVGLPSREELSRALTNASMSIPAVGGDRPFLKMDKGDGTWVYGQEETEVEPGSRWAVNPLSLQHGYIAWKDDNTGVEDEVMMPINRQLPPEASLKTVSTRTGWQRQQSVDLVCISGEDEGTVVQYKQSSVGAMKLFAALTNAILSRVEKGLDDYVPIIVMKAQDYKHKKYGRIYNPIFDIVEWRSMAGEPAEAGGTKPEPAAMAASMAEAEEEESEEDKALAAEYERERVQAQANPVADAPRRRVRRG
jgi:hypothetical protein